MNISKAKTEKEYRKLEALSSSDLRVFISDRKKFFKTRVLGEKVEEEYTRSMLIGHLVHCLLLEEENFDNKYYTGTVMSAPTGKMGNFVNSLYSHYIEEPDQKFSDIAKLAYSDSDFTWSFKTVLEKFIDSPAEDYYNQLIEAKGKGLEIVTAADLNIAEKIISIIRGDINVGPIFNKFNKNREVQILEFYIDGIKLKAMIDDLDIDHENKEINISDLKVVYDNQGFYREYYLKKYAYIQAYLYYRATETWRDSQGLSEYVINPTRFIAVDSGCFYSPLIYELDNKDLDKAYLGFEEKGRWYPGVKSVLEDISWCQENNIWNMSKDQYINSGKVKLI